MSQVTELLLKIRQQGGEQLTRLQNSLKSLGQQSTATNVNFKELASELKNIQQTSVQSINNLRGYATAWREIANSVKTGSAEFKQASAEAAKLEAQLQKVQPGGRGRLAAGAQIAGTIAGAGVFGGIEGALGAGIGGLVGGVPGAIVGGGIGAQVGMARQALGGTASYAAEISKQRQALQLVTKDTGEYQRALSFIDRTSRELAIPQEILTRQFTQLTASVKGAGGNVRDAEKAFIGIASGIRGTGGSLEQLDSALTATSQVFSKGKVSAEELRQQIGERLPGAFSLFAESMGKTPQELDKALENGQVSLQDFQKFAERLFAQYGENAKIIADGPDAAGDRLRTSLSRLNESVGTLLKPMGAEFQKTFASIVSYIDAAIKKLNQFLGLGSGTQGDINRVQKDLNVTDREIKNIEDRLTSLRGKFDPLGETGQLKTSLQNLQIRRAQQMSQMTALYQKYLATSGGTQEPPSNLPGITEDKGKGEKETESRLKKLQSDFERSVAVLGRQFNIETRKKLLNEVLEIENDISKALKQGNIAQVDSLRILQQRRTLEITRDVLINEESALEDKINEGKIKGIDLTNTQNRLSEIRNEREQAVLAITKLNNDEMKDLLKTAQEFNKQFSYGGEAGTMPTLFQAYEDQIKALRESIADTFPKMMQLSEGLANAFAGAFDNLVFKAQSVREALAGLFSNIAQSFQNMILKMISDYLKLQILTFFKNLFAPSPVSLFGNYFGGGASSFANPSFGVDATGLAGPASPFAMGGIMTSMGPLKLKRYATGGIANNPQLALFGEGSNPEAYVPLPDGRSIPVTMKGGNSGASVTVNVDASGSQVQGNSSNANALGSAIGAAVQAELIRQKRPGGLLA